MKKQLSNTTDKDLKFKHFTLKSSHSIVVHKSFIEDGEIDKFNGTIGENGVVIFADDEAEKLEAEKLEAEKKTKAEKVKATRAKNKGSK